MRTSGGTSLRHVGVLTAVGAAALLCAASIACSVSEASSLEDEIGSQSVLLERMQARLSEASVLPGNDAAAERQDEIFLLGATPAVAAAALQRLVIDTVQEAGAEMIESGWEDAGSGAREAGSVDLRVAFTGPIASLQRVLFELERGDPALIVRQIAVAAASETAGQPDSPELRVVMLVGGQWEGSL